MHGEGKRSDASSCASKEPGAGGQLEVGCIVEFPARFVYSPILKARLRPHPQDQFPHLGFRRSQSISDGSKPPEA